MALALDIDVAVPVDRALLERLIALFAHAGEREPCAPHGNWTVALRITNDSEIARLHERFFGDAAATDVISFPSGEPLSEQFGYLGDIVVSLDAARRQAPEVGHGVERELAFLALHGLLHLIGYDDQTEPRRAMMLARQEELLASHERASGVPW
jgi:probable rRNA maturation factor